MLACNQLLILTTLVLANRIEGGVVAYHIAFQVFLLPFALLAHPVMTALYPRLASDAHENRWDGFTQRLREGAGVMAFLALPASALLIALAEPGMRLLRLGNLDAAGIRLAAWLVIAFGVGLVGYAGFQLLTRAHYALGDTRTPTVVALAVAAGGSAAMVAWFAVASGPGRLAAVGYGHSIAYVGGAIALAIALGRRRRPADSRGGLHVTGSFARSLACAVVAGGVAFALGRAAEGGRAVTGAAVAAGAAAGVALYLAVQARLGAPELDWLRGRQGSRG
jgi:putative peptidoglycan lipid II flippase